MKRKEILQSVKEVLFREWDPIGLNSNPARNDEYDSYASGIVRLLQAEADEYKIAEHLRNLQRVSMAMNSTNEERDRGIARRLISLVR